MAYRSVKPFPQVSNTHYSWGKAG